MTLFLNLRTRYVSHEYEVLHAILHIKMAGWLLLEAAQTPLSNLLLLVVYYDIMPFFPRIVCPSFMQNKLIRSR